MSAVARPAGLQSVTQRLLAALRRNDLFSGPVAMEPKAGWPAPQVRPGGVGLVVPVHGSRGLDGDGHSLMAPHARFTVAWPSGDVVFYQDHRFENPWPWPEIDYSRAVGVFPHPGLPPDPETYTHRRLVAYGLYDELMTQLASGVQPAGSWWSGFAQHLAPLLEPGLLPFYRVLAPKFFARIVPEGDDR